MLHLGFRLSDFAFRLLDPTVFKCKNTLNIDNHILCYFLWCIDYISACPFVVTVVIAEQNNF